MTTNILNVLKGGERIGIDTAPLIYFIENHPVYADVVAPVFELIDDGSIVAVSSVITITEVLSQPLKLARRDVENAYRQILLEHAHFDLLPVTIEIAERAAQLRAQYNLRTPDALQIATSLVAGCHAFLTNDIQLRRVTELRILVLNDFIQGSSAQ